MVRLGRGLAVVLLLALLLPLSAAEPVWLQATSPNFVLVTDTSEAKARRLLADLETRFAALGDVLGGIPPRQFPIEVFLFEKSADFLETAPRVPTGTEFTKAAYLIRGPDRIFLVARDKSPEDIVDDAGHALGHVFFERMSWWRPFWLAEGAAEYFRKVGKNPDTKQVSAKDGFPVADLLKIVPSATYDDGAPPTAFRVQSHRLFRVFVNDYPSELRSFLKILRTIEGREATPDVPLQALETRFLSYVETRIDASAAPAASISVREVPAGTLAIHRGDLLVAAGKTSEAASWYNADTNDARAGRAILYRFSRSGGEPIRVLERASRDLPDFGLVHYHFGSIETRNRSDLELQLRALERAADVLPRFGRVHGQMARVSTLLGDPERALTHADRAMELEPEFADEFLLVRAEAYMELLRFDEARTTAETAAASPHVDRGVNYGSKVLDISRRIDEARRQADARRLAQLRAEVSARVAEREPPPPPPPPPPPEKFGDIRYEIQSRTSTEIVSSVLPAYPDALVQKGVAGSITLQVTVGVDGRVSNVVVASSQLAELNAAVQNAVRRWTFRPATSAGKPVRFELRLVFHFRVQ
jgi:protein TonB